MLNKNTLMQLGQAYDITTSIKLKSKEYFQAKEKLNEEGLHFLKYFQKRNADKKYRFKTQYEDDDISNNTCDLSTSESDDKTTEYEGGELLPNDKNDDISNKIVSKTCFSEDSDIIHNDANDNNIINKIDSETCFSEDSDIILNDTIDNDITNKIDNNIINEIDSEICFSEDSELMPNDANDNDKLDIFSSLKILWIKAMLRNDEIRTRLYLKAIESIKASPNTQLNRQIKGAIKNHRKRERKKSKTVL